MVRVRVRTVSTLEPCVNIEKYKKWAVELVAQVVGLLTGVCWSESSTLGFSYLIIFSDYFQSKFYAGETDSTNISVTGDSKISTAYSLTIAI